MDVIHEEELKRCVDTSAPPMRWLSLLNSVYQLKVRIRSEKLKILLHRSNPRISVPTSASEI